MRSREPEIQGRGYRRKRGAHDGVSNHPMHKQRRLRVSAPRAPRGLVAAPALHEGAGGNHRQSAAPRDARRLSPTRPLPAGCDLNRDFPSDPRTLPPPRAGDRGEEGPPAPAILTGWPAWRRATAGCGLGCADGPRTAPGARAHLRMRIAARRPATCPLFDEDTPPRYESSVDAREIMLAIASAPAPYRDAVIAVDLIGLSYREAARSLHIRETTITSRLHRGRQHVARALISNEATLAS